MALRLSAHAAEVLRERGIEVDWVTRAIESPAWTEPDSSDTALTRAFLPIAERGDRILRVVYREAAGELLVVTAFLDRGARRP